VDFDPFADIDFFYPKYLKISGIAKRKNHDRDGKTAMIHYDMANSKEVFGCGGKYCDSIYFSFQEGVNASKFKV